MKLTIDLKNGTQLPACTVSRVEVMTDGSVRLYVDTPDVEIVADDPADAHLAQRLTEVLNFGPGLPALNAALEAQRERAKLDEASKAARANPREGFADVLTGWNWDENGPDEATRAALTEPNALTESLELERKRLQRDTDRSLMGKATSGGKKKDK